jgi:predicted nucleic acid-binding protein
MTQYLQKFELIHFNLKNSLEFARISAELEMNGNIIGDMDILIASIVIGNDDVLYTRNIKHFNKISSLKIINWGDDI